LDEVINQITHYWAEKGVLPHCSKKSCSLRASISTCDSPRSENTSSSDQLSISDQDTEFTETDLGQEIARLEKLKHDLTSLTEARQSELEKKESEKKELTKLCHSKLQEKQKLMKKSSELEQEICHAEIQMFDLKSEQDTLQRELKGLKIRFDNHKALQKQCEDAVEVAEQQLKIFQSKIKAERKHLAELQLSLEATRACHEATREQLEALDAASRVRRESLAELEKQLKTKTEELKKLNKDLAEARN